MVVGESAAAAQDAAEFVAVDYEPLAGGDRCPRRARPRRAASLAGGAGQSRHRLARTCRRSRGQCARGRRDLRGREIRRPHCGDQSAHCGRLDGAARRHRELRCGRRQIYTARLLAGHHASCATISPPSCKVPKERLRVLTEDVGGAFGLKTGAYPEYVALMVGAKKFGRPIHWMSGRSEAFLSDNQARDNYSEAELALDESGRFLALRIRNTANLGAYIGPVGAKFRASASPAACRACTTSGTSTSARAAPSPTRCRPRPIAAPGGRRRTTCSNASSRRRRASPGSIRRSCGGAISSGFRHAVQDRRRHDL